MQSIATDVARSMVCVCVCVGYTDEPYKNDWTNQDGVGMQTRVGSKELCIAWGPGSPTMQGRFWEDVPTHCPLTSTV